MMATPSAPWSGLRGDPLSDTHLGSRVDGAAELFPNELKEQTLTPK